MKDLQITQTTINACRKNFKNEHSKFITKSMMLASDLDREFIFEDRRFTVQGMWINEDSSIEIVISDENKNFYRADHKEVSRMMGYFRYRNAVTGIEQPEDHSKKRLRRLTPEEN